MEAETEKMDLTVYKENNTVYVTAKQQDEELELSEKINRFFTNNNPRANLSIHVPVDCKVRAKTITGKLSISDLEGPITTRVVTGKTKLENLGGAINAKTVTGTLIYNGSLSNDEHRFETTTGKMHFALSHSPDVKLDAQTTTGQIRCDFPVDNKVERRNITGARLKGTLGSGKGNIKARVVTGSMHLEKI